MVLYIIYMSKQNKSKKVIYIIAGFIIALAIAVATILIYRATSFEKAVIDSEYVGSTELRIIDAEEYEKMVSEGKSFILTSYLPTCTARMIKFSQNISEEKNISLFYMDWSDIKKTSLKDVVEFSPSAIIISKGKPIAHLNANSNDDIEKYNNYDVFKAWIEEKVKF